jgi:hypothetical protein
MGKNNRIDISNIEEPSWMKVLSDNSCLNKVDLYKILNLKPTTFDLKVRNGEFPHPDIRDDFDGLFGHKVHVRKCQWKVSTIRNWFKQNKEKSCR